MVDSVPKNKKRKILRRLLCLLLILVVLVNVVAALHAWRFTHYSDASAKIKTEEHYEYTLAEKAKLVLTGIPNARPTVTDSPKVAYQPLYLGKNNDLNCWLVPSIHDPLSPVIIMLHGYGASKSSLIPKSALFHELGYTTLLVDFHGSGGSAGNRVTIGYHEAEDVALCYEYIKQRFPKQKIYLFGSSMGAAALLRFISERGEQPDGIIIECPFGTMHQAVKKRFEMVKAPSFPLAELLTFWGGIENGFWAFDHNPADYAKAVKCPALLMYGSLDERVGKEEIQAVYSALAGPKTLQVFPEAGHNNYLQFYKEDWIEAVKALMAQ